MKITQVRLGRISTPLRVPFKTALRTVNSVEDVIVELHTDTGAVGYGEAPPTGVITGDTAGAIIGAIQDHIAPAILGRDLDEFEDLTAAVQKALVHNTSAKAAVDMALWDLLGQKYNAPVYRMLGGARKNIVTDITISVNPPEEMARDARTAIARGYDCLKVKVGIDPELDFSHMDRIREMYERCTKMTIDPRHPYAGKLVFTAFSGSHQDAINKGLHAMEQRNSEYWEVPYLPIDPADLGREYEPIVRINSQSGKGGVAFVMDHYYGFKLPKVMHKELADEIQLLSERQGEVSPSQIMDKFREMYINAKYPLHFKKMRAEDISETTEGYDTKVVLTYTFKDELKTIEGFGNGPIDAVKHALCNQGGFNTKLTMYEEHALTTGSDSQAASYIELMNSETGEKAFGVGISSNITRSSVRAIFSAMNRLFFRKK